MTKVDENCIDCYKIKCRGCGWEPNEQEVEQIQKNILQNCPICAWSPRRAA